MQWLTYNFSYGYVVGNSGDCGTCPNENHQLLSFNQLVPEEHARAVLNTGCSGKILQEKPEIQF